MYEDAYCEVTSPEPKTGILQVKQADKTLYKRSISLKDHVAKR
jgi:hypothetical protein